jgi:hypothetical protein
MLTLKDVAKESERCSLLHQKHVMGMLILVLLSAAWRRITSICRR